MPILMLVNMNAEFCVPLALITFISTQQRIFK